MPTFKLPPKETKKDKSPDVPIASGTSNPLDWMRSISLPANEDIIDSVQVGDTVEVKLTGRVEEVRSALSKDGDDRNIRVDIAEISVYPSRETEEDFEKGYSEE